MIDPFPRYAELLAWRGAATGQTPCTRRGRRSSRQTTSGTCRSGTSSCGSTPCTSMRDPRIQHLGREGTGFHRRGQGDAASRRARDSPRRRARISQCRSDGPGRAVDLAVLPPDPSAALRHGRLPANASRLPDARERVHPSGGRARAAHACGRAARASVRAAVRRAYGRPKGRSRTRWCRWSRRRDFGGWRRTRRSSRARRARASRATRHGNVEQPDALYRPYRVGESGRDVACGFRDHTLSDLIGFTYASWSPDAAADDFVGRLVEAGRRSRPRQDGEDATIFVILDGENAWEHYEGQGRPFLRALYRRLGSHRELRTVTMSEACAGAVGKPAVDLSGVLDQRRLLHLDRACGRPPGLGPARRCAPGARRLPTRAYPRTRSRRRRKSCSSQKAATGSGGTATITPRITTSSSTSCSAGTSRTCIARSTSRCRRSCSSPTSPRRLQASRFIGQRGSSMPVIDGEVTSYFEWVGSGSVEVTSSIGAMHQVSRARARDHRHRVGFNLEQPVPPCHGHRAMAEAMRARAELQRELPGAAAAFGPVVSRTAGPQRSVWPRARRRAPSRCRSASGTPRRRQEGPGARSYRSSAWAPALARPGLVRGGAQPGVGRGRTPTAAEADCIRGPRSTIFWRRTGPPDCARFKGTSPKTIAQTINRPAFQACFTEGRIIRVMLT